MEDEVEQKVKAKKPFYKKWWVWLIAFLLIAAIIGSGDDEEVTNVAEPEAEVQQESNEPEQSEQNEPTPEVEPETVEEEPEEVVEPEPLPIPDANTYEGSGDDVIQIEKPEDGPVMFYVKGNDGARHMAIEGYDENDNRTSLFVNTTVPYEGITLDPQGTTTLLEISASGPWTIEARSTRSARTLIDTIEGNGDEVILVDSDASVASIAGNPNERHFSVTGYSPNRNLMVNTTDVYDGTVRMDRDTILLEVTAAGDWTISLE